MVELSNKRDLFDFAQRLHTWDANVTTIWPGTKRPAHKWKHWQTTRQTAGELCALPWGKAVAIGVIDGVAGWRDFDFDRCSTFDPVALLLAKLDLPTIYPWVIRTNRGWRVSIVCLDDLPAAILTAKTGEGGGPGVFTFAPKRAGDFDHLELRWRKCQTILAGQHPSGRAYAFVHDLPTEPPAAILLGRVLRATLAVSKLPRDETQPQHQPSRQLNRLATQPDTTAIDSTWYVGQPSRQLNRLATQSDPTRPGRSAAWVAAVLFGELEALTRTQQGRRNIALNRASFTLGQLVGARLLNRADVEMHLETVALELGLSIVEIRDTIRSGLDAGEAYPRNPLTYSVSSEFRAQNKVNI